MARCSGQRGRKPPNLHIRKIFSRKTGCEKPEKSRLRGNEPGGERGEGPREFWNTMYLQISPGGLQEKYDKI
jgi:hypothetical protein